MGLQAFDGLGLPEKGDDDVHRDVGGHAPEHAVRQRLELQIEQRLRLQEAERERTLGDQRLLMDCF